MQKAHDADYNNYWQNLPSVSTPIIAAQLNRNEQTVDTLDDRIITLDTDKANQSDMNNAVQAITYDPTDGSITVTKFGGTVVTYDTDIDKIPDTYDFIDNPNDPHYKNLAITLADGTVDYTDMTTVITENDFNTSGTIQYAISTTGTVEFDIVDYSVTDTKMQPNYLADITAQASSASTSATSASSSKIDSEAWAVGTRNGIPVSMGDPTYQNNAKYYAQHGQGTSFSGLADTLFTNLQDGQIPVYVASSQLWENKDPQGGGKAKVIITGESGSTMSVLFPNGDTVTPTSVTSTTWSFDTSDYGTYVITATKNGSSVSSNLEIKAMQIYEITVSFFSATITVIYPAGATVTCSKEGETTQTATSSPYTFTVHAAGTWTIAGERNGITETQSVLIENNGDAKSVTLTILPNGSTVTPTDDVQTLLKCADIWDKTSYTTIADLIADDTSLLKVLTSNNAIDYLVRSTTFATSIVADEDAMAMIGSYDYASDTLLGNSTWRIAIQNSTYSTSVINIFVPPMTSDNTPSGVVTARDNNSAYDANSKPYMAFDRSGTTKWHGLYSATPYAPTWLRYQFPSAKKCSFATMTPWLYNSNARVKTYKYQGSNDASTWTDLTEVLTADNSETANNEVFTKNVASYKYYQIEIESIYENGMAGSIVEMNFYGRENGGVQSWLRAGGITNKDYTTLAEVLADTTTLSALLSSNNSAYDYLVTATALADGITANANAMSYIGLDNYGANKLIADATWLTAIANSAYVDSVLNVKAPEMTSATTPSGTVYGSSPYDSAYAPYKAFASTGQFIPIDSTGYVAYQFTSAVKIYLVKFEAYRCAASNGWKYSIGTNNADYTDVYTGNGNSDTTQTYYSYSTVISNPTAKDTHKLTSTSNNGYMSVRHLQFYGRVDV